MNWSAIGTAIALSTGLLITYAAFGQSTDWTVSPSSGYVISNPVLDTVTGKLAFHVEPVAPAPVTRIVAGDGKVLVKGSDSYTFATQALSGAPTEFQLLKNTMPFNGEYGHVLKLAADGNLYEQFLSDWYRCDNSHCSVDVGSTEPQ